MDRRRGWIVQWGDRRDFARLERFHYRAGPPATIAPRPDGGPSVLVAREGPVLAGVLVVSMPTLNGTWRDMAWPGRYVPRAGLAKREAASRVNAELRCLSRVIVDPRFRGRGLASALVRAYLACPLTPATEAIAAMGWACPFFERAGMTPYRLPVSPRDARLIDALATVGLEPHNCVDARTAERALTRHPWLVREVRRWTEGSPTTRARAATMTDLELTMAAGSMAGAQPVAYAAVQKGGLAMTEHARPERHATQRKECSAGGGARAARSTATPTSPPVPPPLPPGSQDEAPSAVTIFVPARRRADVLRALRTLDRDRARALLMALGLEPEGATPARPSKMRNTRGGA